MKQEMCGKGLYVLYLDDFAALEIESLTERLPQWRREQALRFRHEAGRRQCVLAYEALRQGLRELYGISEAPDFDYNSHGKPSLRQWPHIHFSLSHCREAVGCLLSERACGLDLEARRPVRESLVRYTMNEDEASLIGSADDPDTAFLRLWTRKEAVLKLRGTGIQGSMKDVLSEAATQDLELHTQLLPRREIVCSWAVKREQ
ncbi:MAG: 4'-phosphopantetheinyl transferase superfamily protein [Bacteroidaceae bacterium]|nr:4'-phosphopantetheinyl transferase superfamily protein [Bacteroidaceae bacterium]